MRTNFYLWTVEGDRKGGDIDAYALDLDRAQAQSFDISDPYRVDWQDDRPVLTRVVLSYESHYCDDAVTLEIWDRDHPAETASFVASPPQ